MLKDTFNYVFKHIKPKDYYMWLSDIYYILGRLGAKELLQGSYKYYKFLKDKF
jgi:hypothetical protein